VPTDVQAILNFTQILQQVTNSTIAIPSDILVVMNDFIEGWRWIAVGLATAVVLGFLWILLMRFCAGPIVWITIISCILVLLGLTAFAWYFGNLPI
jgi:hypothetical protein